MTEDAKCRRLWPAIMVAWLGASLVITLTCASVIAREQYPDPDDILRRLEVRDLIAGQSWWDVDQHRLSSGMMHWSRLVDLPLAAVVLLMRPMLGELTSERVAMVVVPFLTLGVVLALAALLTRRLLDDEHARMSLLMAPLSVPLIYQLRPMRIDHHGWQIACVMAALLAFLSPRSDWRSGAVGGAMLGILLTISLEGLPIAVALLGLVALGWAVQPSRGAHLVGATSATFATAVLLHIATRGPHFWNPVCDAMAPVWLAVLGTAAVATALATLAGGARLPMRVGMLAVGGIACAVVLLLIEPACLAGPFGTLDPIVRTLWYEKVSEGLPLWEQVPAWAAMCMGLPLIALWGAATSLRRATGEERGRWWFMLGAQIAALIFAVQVSRAGATANAFALPGGAAVILALLQRARRVPRLGRRVAATAGVLLLASPGLATFPFLIAGDKAGAIAGGPRPGSIARAPCTSSEDPRTLSALPAARLFAPIDIAPEIIAATDHHAIASGHHRNSRAMRDVLSAFTGTQENAHRIIALYRADYVVACPGFIETGMYRNIAPDGFWARLERGERFDWLRPVAIPGSPVLAWRVVPPATQPLPTSPTRS